MSRVIPCDAKTERAVGQRIRKVWEHSGIIEERIYLGGFELYRRHEMGDVVLERETLHIMDDAQRIAMVETKTIDEAADPFTITPRIRYQLGNHLGSAMLELDDEGLVISDEEYHPYGTSAYRAVDDSIEVSAKRYRYTGKERDEETGLYYHGARYCACWLGRWTSADPAGMVDGPNLFMYCLSNPCAHIDNTGTESSPVLFPRGMKSPRQEVKLTPKMQRGSRSRPREEITEENRAVIQAIVGESLRRRVGAEQTLWVVSEALIENGAFRYNNIFNVQGYGPAGHWIMKSLEEQPDGKQVLKTSPFRAYASLDQAASDYFDHIQDFRKSVWKTLNEKGKTPADFGAALVATRFTTGSTLPQEIQDLASAITKPEIVAQVDSIRGKIQELRLLEKQYAEATGQINRLAVLAPWFPYNEAERGRFISELGQRVDTKREEVNAAYSHLATSIEQARAEQLQRAQQKKQQQQQQKPKE